MTLNNLATAAHSAAVDKGFYQRDRDLPELCMLIVTELAEAVESDRDERMGYDSVKRLNRLASMYTASDWTKAETVEGFRHDVCGSVPEEIADAFIRLFDLCGFYGIDIDSMVAAKMKYNATRPPKHGKAY